MKNFKTTSGAVSENTADEGTDDNIWKLGENPPKNAIAISKGRTLVYGEEYDLVYGDDYVWPTEDNNYNDEDLGRPKFVQYSGVNEYKINKVKVNELDDKGNWTTPLKDVLWGDVAP